MAILDFDQILQQIDDANTAVRFNQSIQTGAPLAVYEGVQEPFPVPAPPKPVNPITDAQVLWLAATLWTSPRQAIANGVATIVSWALSDVQYLADPQNVIEPSTGDMTPTTTLIAPRNGTYFFGWQLFGDSPGVYGPGEIYSYPFTESLWLNDPLNIIFTRTGTGGFFSNFAYSFGTAYSGRTLSLRAGDQLGLTFETPGSSPPGGSFALAAINPGGRVFYLLSHSYE